MDIFKDRVKTHEQLMELQQKELLDKIEAQTAILKSEKEIREMYITRLETEQKVNTKLTADFVKVKNTLKDKVASIHNLSNKIEDSRDTLKMQKDKADDL